MKREYLEETNIVVEPKNIIGIRFNAQDWYIAFQADYICGEPTSDHDENSEVLWVEIEEALSREDVPDLTKKLIQCALNCEQGLAPLPYQGNPSKGKGYLYGIKAI